MKDENVVINIYLNCLEGYSDERNERIRWNFVRVNDTIWRQALLNHVYDKNTFEIYRIVVTSSYGIREKKFHEYGIFPHGLRVNVQI
jgi:hypothetical protein